MVPFCGRIIFRQYNKQKRHRYGIKEFKLCPIPRYTYKISIYAVKNDHINTTPTNVVTSLCKDLLNKSHILYTDNWYTNVDLIRQLLDQQTNLVGTIRNNRRDLPKHVVTAKLKKGEFTAAKSSDRIAMMKWKDKGDVYVLSTKHSVRFHQLNKRGKAVSKPKIVVDYNIVKSAVGMADQLAAYSTPLRKSIKLNTSIVNALILYKRTTNKNISMGHFRKKIVQEFCVLAQNSCTIFTRIFCYLEGGDL